MWSIDLDWHTFSADLLAKKSLTPEWKVDEMCLFLGHLLRQTKLFFSLLFTSNIHDNTIVKCDIQTRIAYSHTHIHKLNLAFIFFACHSKSLYRSSKISHTGSNVNLPIAQQLYTESVRLKQWFWCTHQFTNWRWLIWILVASIFVALWWAKKSILNCVEFIWFLEQIKMKSEFFFLA